MDNKAEHGITPQGPASPRPAVGDEAFTLHKRFPGEMSSAPPPVSPQSGPSSGRIFSRVVLPLILLVLVIGGIAWVTQYMPAAKKPDTTNQPAQSEELLIKFDEVRSIWDPDDKEYARETESTVAGHYDFPFENPTDETVLLGALDVSCTCSQVEAALVPADQKGKPDFDKLSWRPLEAPGRFDVKKTIEVPPKGRGAIRVGWKEGKLKDSLSRLHVALGMQVKVRPEAGQVQRLETVVRSVPAVMLDPLQLRIGEVAARGTARAEFILWSATRPSVDLRIKPDGEDSLVDVELTELPKEELAEVRTKLKPTYNTRPKAAWRAEVTVYEQKDGRQLPQGPFRRELQITADGEKLAGPTIYGTVPGEVQIGTSADGGAVKLDRFAAKTGIKKRSAVWTEPNVQLVLEGHRPGYIKVNLVENKKDSTPNRRRWDLEIEVPPGGPVGPLPEDSVIILKTQSAPPRQIHIPLRGSATPG